MATVSPSVVSVGVSLPETFIQPIPIRQRIVDRLAARLARIKIANGYFTDAGNLVVYGQLSEPNPDKSAYSVYLWDSDESNERLYGADTIEMDVTTSMFFLAPDHITTPMEWYGNRMLADMKKGMILNDAGQHDPTIDKLASNLVYVSGTIQPGLRDVPWVNALVQWTVTYLQKTEDPTWIKSQSA